MRNDDNHDIISNGAREYRHRARPWTGRSRIEEPGYPGCAGWTAPEGDILPPSIPIEELGDIPSVHETEFGPMSVCGTDNRVEVGTPTDSPYERVCYLLITKADGSLARGTGWFNGYGSVITAGHVVYSKSQDAWAKQIEIIPARSGSDKPFGSQIGTNLHTVKGWKDNHDTNYDYGAIILPNQSLGKKTGYFGFGSFSDRTLEAASLTICGYPADKPGKDMWYADGSVDTLSDDKIHYLIDTSGGDSGAPDWIDFNGKIRVAGIHTHGGCPNYGTRINESVFNNLKTWKGYGGS